MPYFATEDNCRLYYELRGKGKAVVFIHGWDCNRHFFKNRFPPLPKSILSCPTTCAATAIRTGRKQGCI